MRNNYDDIRDYKTGDPIAVFISNRNYSCGNIQESNKKTAKPVESAVWNDGFYSRLIESSGHRGRDTKIGIGYDTSYGTADYARLS